MIVRRFLLWARTANASDRAAATRALAEAYLRSAMSHEDRREAETALLAMLDDPSALVRRAMAEALATENAPRAIILGLAQDQPDVAAYVLAASPVLTQADLVDAVAVGGELVQSVIARRSDIGIALAAAIVEVACDTAVQALIENDHADIAPTTLQHAANRAATAPELREALLSSPNLPVSIRHQLALDVATSLSSWAGGCGLMSQQKAERVTREASEKVALSLAASADGFEADLMSLIAQLRRSNRLTPGLMLRSLLSGETALAEAALADLAGMPLARASGIMHDRRGNGIAALCRKAGIPPLLIPAFISACEAVRDIGAPASDAQKASISRRIIERVLIACDRADADENAPLMALLRRFEADAAREEAHEMAQAMADDAALSALLEIDPELTLLVDEEVSGLVVANETGLRAAA
ncbi:MAG: DUF2336 domain-containing protein [Bosea sp. (in: a-proteobacteria)]